MIRLTKSPVRGGLSAVLSLLMLACGRTLPPPAAPPIGNPPPVALPDAQLGQTPIVLDVNEPSQVSVVLARTEAVAYGDRGASSANGTRTQQICARTPCAVAMPQGQVELRFQSLENEDARSTDTVDVHKRPSVFRHSLGEVSVHPAPYFGGWTLATTGLVLGGAGAFVTSETRGNSEPPHRFLGMSQGTSLAVGGLLLAGGITLIYLFQPSVRSGSSSTFDIASTR